MEKQKRMLPSHFRILPILIGIQVYRLAGLSLLLFSASLPPAFLIPTVFGDTLTAVLAPIIAIGISKTRGPRVWAAALAWNILGVTDLFYALTIGLLTTAGTFVIANDLGVIIGATIGILLHITSITLLLRKTVMNYLLTPR